MKCIDEKNRHIGVLETICEYEYSHIANGIIKWCSRCGAIVIDKDINGRIYPGSIMKMRFPTKLVEDLN